MKSVLYSFFLCLTLMFVGANLSGQNFAWQRGNCNAITSEISANAESVQNVESVLTQQNAFRVKREINADDAISISYIFPVNSALMLKNGFDESDVKTYRFHLSTFINALASQNRAKAVEGMTVSACLYFADVDGLGFSIVFKNSSVQKEFFGQSEEEDTKPSNTKVSGFFIKKMEIMLEFPISKTGADNLKAVCSMAIASWVKNVNLTDAESDKMLSYLEDATFIYDFASTSDSLKSNVMYEEEGNYHNIFVKSYSQLEEEPQIIFYSTYVNTPVWYGAALVVTIAGMAVAYILLKKRSKKNNTQKNEK